MQPFLLRAGPTHAVSGPYPAALLAGGKGNEIDVVQQRAYQAFLQ